LIAAAALGVTVAAGGRSLMRAPGVRRERPFEILTPQAMPLAHNVAGAAGSIAFRLSRSSTA
jgi:hypothetical protein